MTPEFITAAMDSPIFLFCKNIPAGGLKTLRPSRMYNTHTFSIHFPYPVFTKEYFQCPHMT